MLLQLKDNEFEDWGLIETSQDVDLNEVERLWKEYWNDSDDPDADEFSEVLTKHFPFVIFIHVHADEINL